MITPEISEPFALLNYKHALFNIDDADEAIAALKNAAKELTGFEYEMSFKKHLFSDTQVLVMNSDPKQYNKLFRNRITLHPSNGNAILSIQLRDGQKPIEHTMELTSEIYRQLQKGVYLELVLVR